MLTDITLKNILCTNASVLTISFLRSTYPPLIHPSPPPHNRSVLPLADIGLSLEDFNYQTTAWNISQEIQAQLNNTDFKFRGVSVSLLKLVHISRQDRKSCMLNLNYHNFLCTILLANMRQVSF